MSFLTRFVIAIISAVTLALLCLGIAQAAGADLPPYVAMLCAAIGGGIFTLLPRRSRA